MTDTTRRYPRTLQEAFGPYANGSQLQTEYEPMDQADKIVLAACAIAAVALVAMTLAGWLK